MLRERGIPFEYREYTQDPLSEGELRALLQMLEQSAASLLRRRDPAYWELGLDGSEPEDQVIAAMVAHPTLLERPIGVIGQRAAVGRPPERLVELWEASVEQP